MLSNWEIVPFTDPFCLASNAGAASPDITGFAGPIASAGLFGQANSGTTFVSGLFSTPSSPTGTTNHDGIHQVVDGFEIGGNYTLEFFQSVVKQSSARDTSGSWDVYMNDSFLARSVVSISQLSHDNPNLQWEKRSIAFTAPSASISFKFLVADDDNNGSLNSTDLDGSLRMGIDDISLFSCLNSPLSQLDPQSIAFSEDSICLGQEVTISDWPQGFSANCQWEFSDGQSFTDCAIPAINFSSPGNVTASLTMSDIQGCSFEFTSDELLILPAPLANFMMNPESIESTSPLVRFENLSENADAFVWDFGDGASSTNIDPVHSYLNTSEGTVEVCLEAISNLGCSSQVCKDLEIEEPLEIYIPNSFSPDQDGLNDYWQVHLSTNRLSLYELRITNRWGQEIWSSDNPLEQWDGRGAEASSFFSPSGTYVYQLTCQESRDSETLYRVGHVILVR